MYFRSYTCLTEHILVLRILYLCYRAYSYIYDLILVFQILYLYYGTCTCLTDLKLVLQNLFLYFGSYTCVIELILVLRILYLCYRTDSCISDLILVRRWGTISRNRLELYHIQAHIRLMQIRTLVRSRYRSHQIHIPGSYRFRTYPKTNRVVGLYQNHL